jgi:hypothetical protein
VSHIEPHDHDSTPLWAPDAIGLHRCPGSRFRLRPLCENPINVPKEIRVTRVPRPVAVLLLAPVLLVAGLLGGCSGSTAPPPAVPATWPVPADPQAAAAKAGLPMLGSEMLEIHYHAHLDLLIRGVAVAVPAYIGIDLKKQQISPLHTHDTSGVAHIESATDIPFTLGQFFAEWGQPLNANHIGPATVGAGEKLRVYLNGQELAGDPAAAKFVAHGEYYFWLGPADGTPSVPSSYTFPAGQ